MNLVPFLLFLTLVGMLMWFVHKYIPVGREIRRVLTIALAVIVLLWIAHVFDMFDFMEGFHFDR